MQAHRGVDGLSVDTLFETQKFLRKTKNFAKCEKNFKAKEKINKPIGKHATNLKNVEGRLKNLFPLKRPKIR